MDQIRKPKYRIKWNVIIPLVICVILTLYLFVSLAIGLISKGGKDDDIYRIGKLTGRQTRETILKENRENPVEIYDYNFYGESLNLFYDYYSLDIAANQTLKNRTVVLKDLLSDNVVRFENLSGKLDSQINLGKLKPGFYSVYIEEGETLQRVYMSRVLTLDNTFYTVMRNNQSTKVELLANKALFDSPKKEESLLDKNYLYIRVDAVTAEEYGEVDVAISTAPAMSGDVAVSPVGEERNGIVEAEEMFEMAQAVAARLQEAGLKVAILKDSFDDPILYYGQDGVAHRAYRNNAKYLIHLDMYIDTTTTGVFYSNYTGNDFARAIFTRLMSDTSLFESEDKLRNCTTVTSSLLNDDMLYDQDWVIREAGGAVLGAGRFSQTSTANAAFAKDRIYGINTVDLVFINIKDKEQVDSWLANKAKAAEAIAQGIIDYLK